MMGNSFKNLVTLFLISIFISSCSPSQSVLQTAISGTQTAIAVNTPIIVISNAFTLTPEPLPTLKPTNTPSVKQLSSIHTPIEVLNLCEFQVTKIEFAKKILPPNTSGYYSYYEVKTSNSTFLDVVITVKNLDTITKSVDDLVSISILYDNNYTYNSSPIVVDSDGGFTYAIISGVQPLLSKEAHYLFTVPMEVQNSSKSLIIIFYVGDKEFQYQYR